MTVFVNGRFVPEHAATVSVFDRGFLYGDGLFETVRVANGIPFRWTQHVQRLEDGARLLHLKLPYAPSELLGIARRLIKGNNCPESLLRVAVSRGVGRRGCSPKGADNPTVVISLHPAPELDEGSVPEWTLSTSTLRLMAADPLASAKTCSKLVQVLARAEAEARGAHEALLLNSEGHVVEAASGNLFWYERESVCTTPLVGGILPGITRAVVFELVSAAGACVVEKNITPAGLAEAEGVFLTLSSYGIVIGVSLDGCILRRSPHLDALVRAYGDLLRKETSGT
jgi:aminodeoxychorismate lyase